MVGEPLVLVGGLKEGIVFPCWFFLIRGRLPFSGNSVGPFLIDADRRPLKCLLVMLGWGFFYDFSRPTSEIFRSTATSDG